MFTVYGAVTEDLVQKKEYKLGHEVRLLLPSL